MEYIYDEIIYDSIETIRFTNRTGTKKRVTLYGILLIVWYTNATESNSKKDFAKREQYGHKIDNSANAITATSFEHTRCFDKLMDIFSYPIL